MKKEFLTQKDLEDELNRLHDNTLDALGHFYTFYRVSVIEASAENFKKDFLQKAYEFIDGLEGIFGNKERNF